MDDNFFAGLVNILRGLDLDVWALVKLAVLLGLFIYLAFSIMIVRQVSLMSRALNGSFASPLKFFAWIYLAATVIVFLLALILL